jgi:hypothetical protein
MTSSVPEKTISHKNRFRRRAAVAAAAGVAALAIGIPSAGAAEKTFSFNFGNGQSASIDVTYPDDWEAAITQLLQAAPSTPTGSSSAPPQSNSSGRKVALRTDGLVQVPTYVPNIPRNYEVREGIYALNTQIRDFNTRKQSIPVGLVATDGSKLGKAIQQLNSAQESAASAVAQVTSNVKYLNGFVGDENTQVENLYVNHLIGQQMNARSSVTNAVNRIGAVNEARANP